jgi:hypothetical protein
LNNQDTINIIADKNISKVDSFSSVFAESAQVAKSAVEDANEAAQAAKSAVEDANETAQFHQVLTRKIEQVLAQDQLLKLL